MSSKTTLTKWLWNDAVGFPGWSTAKAGFTALAPFNLMKVGFLCCRVSASCVVNKCELSNQSIGRVRKWPRDRKTHIAANRVVLSSEGLEGWVRKAFQGKHLSDCYSASMSTFKGQTRWWRVSCSFSITQTFKQMAWPEVVFLISLQALCGQLRAPHTDSSTAITAHALTMRYFCCANMSVQSSGILDLFMCMYLIFFSFFLFSDRDWCKWKTERERAGSTE